MSLSAPFLASKKEEIAKASGACLTLYPAEGVKRMSVAFSLFEELEKKENSRIRERVSVYGVEEFLPARLGCKARKAGRG